MRGTVPVGVASDWHGGSKSVEERLLADWRGI
jgi:hypothetical protein